MRKLWIILAIVFCFLLTGCSFDIGESGQESVPDNFEAKAYTVGPISVPSTSMRTLYAIYRTKLLYSESSADKKVYIYDFETGETEEIGIIPNMLMQCRGYTWVGDTYYFYINVMDNLVRKNVLYAVDFSENKMYKVSENRYANTFISLTTIDGEIYALQGDMQNGVSVPFLEKIGKRGKGERIEVYREPSDIETRLMWIAADNGRMYALERNDYAGNDPANFRLFFSEFDSEFNRVYTKEITDIYNGQKHGGTPMNGGIGEFLVFGNYFFMFDFGGSGILCEFDTESDSVEVLFHDGNLEYSDGSGGGDFEYFYLRGTNDIYRLNKVTGDFELLYCDADNENSIIRKVMVYGDELFIAKRPLDRDKYKTSETWYLVPVSDVSQKIE